MILHEELFRGRSAYVVVTGKSRSTDTERRSLILNNYHVHCKITCDGWKDNLYL